MPLLLQPSLTTVLVALQQGVRSLSLLPWLGVIGRCGEKVNSALAWHQLVAGSYMVYVQQNVLAAFGQRGCTHHICLGG